MSLARPSARPQAAFLYRSSGRSRSRRLHRFAVSLYSPVAAFSFPLRLSLCFRQLFEECVVSPCLRAVATTPAPAKFSAAPSAASRCSLRSRLPLSASFVPRRLRRECVDRQFSLSVGINRPDFVPRRSGSRLVSATHSFLQEGAAIAAIDGHGSGRFF